MTVQLNPRGVADEYLKCLNLCFGNWGDRRQFDWYFQRHTALPKPDLIVLKISGETAAGSAVSYRKVALPNDHEIDVGIMTGSWTLPQFRGQGCFARIIEESVQVTTNKSAALLLAFVTEENASFRQLAKAGAALFPASYLVSNPLTHPAAGALQFRAVEKTNEVITAMFDRLEKSSHGYCRLTYATAGDFRAQLVDRPGATEILGDSLGNFGIVERKESTDILQLCLAAEDDHPGIAKCMAGLLNHALARERRLFLYSTRSDVTRAGLSLGLQVKPGQLAVLATEGFQLPQALGVASPLRTSESSQLAQADSPWFLGEWNVQSGDRT